MRSRKKNVRIHLSVVFIFLLAFCFLISGAGTIYRKISERKNRKVRSKKIMKDISQQIISTIPVRKQDEWIIVSKSNPELIPSICSVDKTEFIFTDSKKIFSLAEKNEDIMISMNE